MAITYETALKLKEAGFPQEISLSAFYDCGKYGRGIELQFIDEATGDFLCNAPPLEELIEACGKEFRWLKNEKTQWHAQQRQHPASLGDVRAKGSNPSEAVAALWLKLNKKV